MVKVLRSIVRGPLEQHVIGFSEERRYYARRPRSAFNCSSASKGYTERVRRSSTAAA
jgi:hypothetical protein